MGEFKLLVGGGADFSQYSLLANTIEIVIAQKKTYDEIIIVCGASAGAEMLAERYATEKGYEVAEFLANSAENIDERQLREQEMAAYADYGLIFWDKKCPEVRQFIDLLIAVGLNLRVVTY